MLVKNQFWSAVVLRSFLWDYPDLLILQSLSQDFSFPYKFTFAVLSTFHTLHCWHTAQCTSWTKNVFFFFKYWQMIQSLNRLFVFQRLPPTPYNSTLVVVHSMCSLSIRAHFVLVCEPEKMTSGRWAFQPPPRLCPKTHFSVPVLCCFGAVCSYICI